MKLSERLKAACQEHRDNYPNGNWKAANEKLGILWNECSVILESNNRSPYLGNQETIMFLEDLGL